MFLLIAHFWWLLFMLFGDWISICVCVEQGYRTLFLSSLLFSSLLPSRCSYTSSCSPSENLMDLLVSCGKSQPFFTLIKCCLVLFVSQQNSLISACQSNMLLFVHSVARCLASSQRGEGMKMGGDEGGRGDVDVQQESVLSPVEWFKAVCQRV